LEAQATENLIKLQIQHPCTKSSKKKKVYFLTSIEHTMGRMLKQLQKSRPIVAIERAKSAKALKSKEQTSPICPET
jgi:hypothetical protein